jgi:hypothetical protein
VPEGRPPGAASQLPSCYRSSHVCARLPVPGSVLSPARPVSVQPSATFHLGEACHDVKEKPARRSARVYRVSQADQVNTLWVPNSPSTT